jgi:hypothetical protein
MQDHLSRLDAFIDILRKPNPRPPQYCSDFSEGSVEEAEETEESAEETHEHNAKINQMKCQDV